MDYKYIEQLLDRYWACESTLEEEEILRAFFCQADLPSHLQQYSSVFVYQHEEPKTDCLGDDFDAKILELTDDTPIRRAQTVSIYERLRPLFRAAAVVAIVLTLSNAMQSAFDNNVSSPALESATPHEGPSVAAANPDSVEVVENKTIINIKTQ